jgi:hypothetical protein
MKAFILSAVAAVALTGVASADIINENTGLLVERRTDARGNSFWVHVRPEQATTTVAVFRSGQQRAVVREDREIVATTRQDQHGRTHVEHRAR